MPLQEFEFISWSEGSSAKLKIRAHILRRHHGFAGYYEDSAEVLSSRHRSGAHLPSAPMQQLPPGVLDREATGKNHERSNQIEHDRIAKAMRALAISCRLQRPATSLSQVFTSCGVSMSARERHLVHHFITQTSSPLYKIESMDVKFDPPRDIAFKLMIDNGVGLLALATAATYDLARLTTGQMTIEATEFELKSIRLLKERLLHPDTCADDMSVLLILVFIHADCEIFFENRSQLQTRAFRSHLQGLRRIILHRGGFQAFRENHLIGWLLHWYDIVLCGEISVGLSSTSYFSSCPVSESQMAVLPKDMSAFPQTIIGQAALELINFYSTMVELMISQHSGIEAAHSYLLDVFTSSGLTPILFQTGSETRPFASLATLIYLTATVLEACNESGAVLLRQYLNQVKSFIFQQRLHHAPDHCVLFWILITDPDTFTLLCPERLWLVSRMMWLLKRLDGDFNVNFQNAMLELLFGAKLQANTPQHVWSLSKVIQEVYQSPAIATSDLALDQ